MFFGQVGAVGNLWDPDGIHFRQEFYPYWATELVIAALMGGKAE